MTDLRKLARGQSCTVRVPNICTGDTDTTVLAHYRLMGMSGAGMKSPDWLGAYCCYACHMACDGQAASTFTRDELRLMLAEGVFRTQAILFDNGILVRTK